MRLKTKLFLGFGIAIAIWIASINLLPCLTHCAPARLPYAVLATLLYHAREVCAGQSEFGSTDSLLLKHIEDLRDEGNNYFVVRFPPTDSTVAAIAAYPRKKEAYFHTLPGRLVTWDWELQSQWSYVLTAGGELYRNHLIWFDSQTPVAEGLLPASQPQAWTLIRNMSMLPPCN